MNARRILMIVLTTVLVIAAFAGAVNATQVDPKPVVRTTLANVRDYAAAPTTEGINYAIDGGELFAGMAGNWVPVSTPEDVIVNAVTVDQARPDQVYIGAANEMAIYKSVDAGQNWQRIRLTTESIGGVTDIAVDSTQRLIYVGTDTAGLFRLRDVGESVILNAHLLLEEPVVEIAVDGNGSGLAFARTERNLYRAENFGLSWVTVDNLHSYPTALAIAETEPATVYVGTVDRGVLQSEDGLTWQLANEGLGMVPGSRLRVNALAVDPAQPDVVYAATSFIYGSTTTHETPSNVAMTTDNAQAWAVLPDATTDAAVAALLPVAGETGAVYALTTQSREPLALGNAPAVTVDTSTVAAAIDATPESPLVNRSLIAWAIAGMAAIALVFAVVTDLRSRRPQPVTGLAPELVGRRNR